jgi:hypothetical protein
MMAFQPKPIGFGPYKQWRETFNTEKVYTRAEMSRALQDQRREFEKATTVLGVKQLLPQDYEVMMRIIRIERSPEGIFIVVC